MRRINRVFIIVLDSAGAGFLPDAADYGDLGANTLGHIGEAVGLTVPNMEALGLGNILPIRGVAPIQNPRGAWGK
ncbi:MAG TPA: phosphopentomutase, partial [Treponemataceae bacterium]|nr:phosphopentomutase [Treponemataceae bacterium]